VARCAVSGAGKRWRRGGEGFTVQGLRAWTAIKRA
jgi:hypothetical protein